MKRICSNNNESCCGYKEGECISTENCQHQEEVCPIGESLRNMTDDELAETLGRTSVDIFKIVVRNSLNAFFKDECSQELRDFLGFVESDDLREAVVESFKELLSREGPAWR